MIYDSSREARVPGFDAWYWGLFALLPRAARVLLIAGASTPTARSRTARRGAQSAASP